MAWVVILAIYPERKQGIKLTNITTQAMLKWKQIYGTHELFWFLYGKVDSDAISVKYGVFVHKSHCDVDDL